LTTTSRTVGDFDATKSMPLDRSHYCQSIDYSLVLAAATQHGFILQPSVLHFRKLPIGDKTSRIYVVSTFAIALTLALP
jgi:hypothetical protein